MWTSKLLVNPGEMVGVLMISATFNLYVSFYIQWLLLKLVVGPRA